MQPGLLLFVYVSSNTITDFSGTGQTVVVLANLSKIPNPKLSTNPQYSNLQTQFVARSFGLRGRALLELGHPNPPTGHSFFILGCEF